MNAKEALELFHNRPGMYWGDSRYLFTSWIAFMSGYQMGYDMAQRKDGIRPEDFVPEDFHKFVTERFGETFPAGGRGWMSFIRENTSSEKEAFDLFFQLRGEYERAKSARS